MRNHSEVQKSLLHVKNGVTSVSVPTPRGIDTPTLSSNKTLASHKEYGNGSMLGFLLPLVIEQQLTGGKAGYYRLAKVASLLNLSIVEPYLQNTGLTGAPIVSTKLPVLKFGNMYDLNEIKSILKYQIPNSDVVSFEYFLERASRQVLHLVFSTSKKARNKRVSIDSCIGIKPVEDIRRLNKWTSHVAKQSSTQALPFHCSRAVVVDARPSHPLPLSEITEVLGSIIRKHAEEYGSVTVMVSRWRSIHVTDSKYFYVIPDWTGLDTTQLCCVKHSETVVNATLEYAGTLKSAHPVIGVHIRAERLLLGHRINTTRCLRELSNILRNGSITNATDDKVHLFHDLGEYGTMSCGQHCGERGSRFISQIKQLGFPIVHYDPNKFKSFPRHRSFVALVEQEYLSRVDVLVTVGFGGFQQGVVNGFFKYHGRNSENVHRICYQP